MLIWAVLISVSRPSARQLVYNYNMGLVFSCSAIIYFAAKLILGCHNHLVSEGWSLLISDFKLHPIIILRENWSFPEPSLNAFKVLFLIKLFVPVCHYFYLNITSSIVTVKANDVFDVQIIHCRLIFWPCAAICLCLSDLFLYVTSYVHMCSHVVGCLKFMVIYECWLWYESALITW